MRSLLTAFLVGMAVVAPLAATDDWSSLLFTTTQENTLGYLSSAVPEVPGSRLGILAATTEVSVNPSGAAQWGDGDSWAGKGVNTNSSGGVSGTWPLFAFSVNPVFWTADNAALDLPAAAMPPYGDFHRGAWDHPLRMGTDPLRRFAWGDSFATLSSGPAFVKVGTPYRQWGASRFNNLLLTSNGPGIPSVELGLSPWATVVGTFEAHYIAGNLQPSGWQAESTASGDRLWTGLFLAYSFPVLPDLTLSAARTIQSSWDDRDARDLMVPFVAKTRWGVDKYDQRASLGYRWRFPREGLELYGEWGRNDYSPKILAWLQNLERTQAYVFGFRKSFNSSIGLWAVEGEVVSAFLGPEALINFNGYHPNGVDYYTHGTIREGYTIEGQDLGAAVGNGNALSFTVAWIGRDVAAKVDFRRWVKDYSVLIATLDRTAEYRINVQFEADSEVRWTLGPVTWIAGFTPVYEISPFFEANKQVTSFRAKLGVQYRP